MKFKITTDFNDGLANAPSIEVEVGEVEELGFVLFDEMCNDNGVSIPVGATVTIERVA